MKYAGKKHAGKSNGKTVRKIEKRQWCYALGPLGRDPKYGPFATKKEALADAVRHAAPRIVRLYEAAPLGVVDFVTVEAVLDSLNADANGAPGLCVPAPPFAGVLAFSVPPSCSSKALAALRTAIRAWAKEHVTVSAWVAVGYGRDVSDAVEKIAKETRRVA